MGIRDFYIAPCTPCKVDTTHFAGKCRDCGHINYPAPAVRTPHTFGKQLKVARRMKRLNAERKKWQAETANRNVDKVGPRRP
jgi:predicted ATP-dependent serine protease